MKKTIKQFINDVKNIHNDVYDYSLVEYTGAKSFITIICKKHGTFVQRADVHLSGCGCRKCFEDKRIDNTEIFIEKCKKIHNDKYDYSLVNYKGSKNKVEIICPTHGIFKQKPYNHLTGQGCKICTLDNNIKTLNNFINECKKIHNDKYDYSLVNYIGNKYKIKIICPIHGEFEQRASNHLSGQNCIKCENKNKKTNEEFIMKSTQVHYNKYDYSLVNYIGNKYKIKIICPIHGEFEQSPSSHINGCGCSVCSESKGEKEIRNILNDKKILYNTQKSFKKCKYKNVLKFDFYLPEYNICIEFDGRQHFESVRHWGGIDGLSERIKKDKIKTDYCINNNILLYRIKYNENINEKMNEILSNLK
jgi:hypothetical protein